MKVKAVGYVGINATDVESWQSFATNVVGAQVVSDSKDLLRMKIDDYAWRIAVQQADTAGFAYAGLEFATSNDFDAAVSELAAAGAPVSMGTDEELKARRVGGLAVTADPAGNRLELYYRPTLDYSFHSPLGASFVTEGQGFGHMVFLVESGLFDATLGFYVDTLGFRVSEFTRLGEVEVVFLHCNERHHSVALARAPISMCQHIMLQVTDLDMVGQAWDRAHDAGVSISATLGRHRNDNMFSFYMATPSGLDLEFGWGARSVDDESWVVSEWEGGDVWGHRGVADLV